MKKGLMLLLIIFALLFIIGADNNYLSLSIDTIKAEPGEVSSGEGTELKQLSWNNSLSEEKEEGTSIEQEELRDEEEIVAAEAGIKIQEVQETEAVVVVEELDAAPSAPTLLDKIKEHSVQKGESLWTISQKYDIDIDTIIGANDITNMNRIQVGDIITILPVKGILYKINPGESLWEISRQFDVDLEEIIEANGIENPDLVEPGKLLLLPGAKPEFGYEERLSQNFIAPVEATISSYYGWRWGRMHEGIDYAVNVGTQVQAARSGTVIYSGWATGYGYTVIIEHQKGVRTLYAHNSSLLVHSGQWVEKGQAISLSGNTGNSTGPHLHFEIQINGKPVDPLNYLN